MIKLVLTILITTSYFKAQEIIYYTKFDKKTTKDSAYYYRSIIKLNEIDNDVTDYYMNGNKKAQGHYRYMEPEYRQGKFNYYSEDGKLSATRTFFSKEHGTSTYYYPNGNVMVTRKYNEGIEIDSLKSYYASGELKRIQLFSGKTPTGKVYTKTGADTVFYAYEERAFYKGTKQELDEFAYRHLIYPKQAKKDGFKGIVIVLCTVTENGILEEAKVLKTSHDFLNDNALEFVKKIPAWNPSRNDGVPYKSKAIISINFGFR